MPALELHLRTTCASCGNPIPLTSAHLPVTCPTCDAVAAIDGWSFYWVVRERVIDRSESDGGDLVGDARPSDVKCAKCKAVVAEEAIEKGLSSSSQGGGELLRCGCGHVIPIRAVPDDIDRKGWWSAFVGEKSAAATSTSTQAASSSSTTPIQFKCTNCGGALSVDGTSRTPTCTFCNTRVYLPDDLWRALRPTPKVEPFYLWVSRERSDAWEAKRFRAILIPLAVVGTGTVLAAVAGIAVWAVEPNHGQVDGGAGASAFFIVFIASVLIAAILRRVLSPKTRALHRVS